MKKNKTFKIFMSTPHAPRASLESILNYKYVGNYILHCKCHTVFHTLYTNYSISFTCDVSKLKFIKTGKCVIFVPFLVTYENKRKKGAFPMYQI